MTSPMLQHIPLKSAYLCQDCDCIGNSSVQCPACASTALLGLSSVLNRQDVEFEMSIPEYAYSSSVLSSVLAA